MNPSYKAYHKALLATLMNTLMGVEPPAPKAKKDPNVGPAFAPGGGGIQQDESSEEKEVKVQAHLDKLAAECKQRYLDDLNELPYVKVIENYGVTKAYRAHAEYIDKQIVLNRNIDLHTGREYLPDEPDPIVDNCLFNHANGLAVLEAMTSEAIKLRERYDAIAEEEYPSVTIAQTEEMDKAAYDCATKALLKLANITEIHDEPKYPRSDMVEEAEEAQAEAEAHVPLSDRIAKACVHSGERANLNYDNYTDEAL